MSALVKGIAGGGGNLTITNGILKEYYAQTGEIPAGTFVEMAEGIEGYVSDLVNLLTENITTYVSLVEMSNNRIFISFTTVHATYGFVIKMTSEGIVVGDTKQIFASSFNEAPTVCSELIDDNLVLVFAQAYYYNDSGFLCTVDDITITTVSSKIYPPGSTNGFSTSYGCIRVEKLTESLIIVSYPNGSSASKTYGGLTVLRIENNSVKSQKDYPMFVGEKYINQRLAYRCFRISDNVFLTNKAINSPEIGNLAFYQVNSDDTVSLIKTLETSLLPFNIPVYIWGFFKLNIYNDKYVIFYSNDYNSIVKASIFTISEGDYSISGYTEPIDIHPSITGNYTEIFHDSETDNDFVLINKSTSGIKAIKISVDENGNITYFNDVVISVSCDPLKLDNDHYTKSYKVSDNRYRIYCTNPSYIELDLTKEVKTIIPATSSANMVGFTKDRVTTEIKGKTWLLNE